jgi:hypothetical protein
MKKVLILLVPVLFVSACSEPYSAYLAVHRSDVVKVCSDGTLVGFDPQTKRYTVAKNRWVGIVAEGIKLEDICQETN